MDYPESNSDDSRDIFPSSMSLSVDQLSQSPEVLDFSMDTWRLSDLEWTERYAENVAESESGNVYGLLSQDIVLNDSMYNCSNPKTQVDVSEFQNSNVLSEYNDEH